MKRTTRNAEKAKQEIVQKAAPVFNTNGFAGTSMQMIIDATGYQKGGIYCHFDSKKDLAKAAFEYNYNQLQKIYFKGVAKQDSAKAQLLTFLENYQYFLANPSMKGGCPLLNTATEMDDTDKEFRLLVKSKMMDFAGNIEGIIQRGIDSQEFQKGIDPNKEVLFLIASVEGSVMMGQLTRSKDLVLDIFERLRAYLEGRVFK